MYLLLKDKNGVPIMNNSVVIGKIDNAEHFFRVYQTSEGEFEMFSSSYGYVHNLQPRHLKDFVCCGHDKEVQEASADLSD